MKSLITVRRARPFVTGALCASVIVGFIACSGSSERRAGRNTGEGGEYEAAAGAGAASQSGGSSAHGGEPATGGVGGAEASGGSDATSGGEPNGGNQAAGGESVGGAVGVAGEASGGAAAAGAAGEAIGGAAGEANGGNGGDGGNTDVIDPVCGLNMVQVGAYSLWCGKVNMHETAPGVWTHDADCSSGCNVKGVGYCQKFYPSATAVATVPLTQTKDWKNAGCADSAPDGPGESEAVCCAPLP